MRLSSIRVAVACMAFAKNRNSCKNSSSGVAIWWYRRTRGMATPFPLVSVLYERWEKRCTLNAYTVNLCTLWLEFKKYEVGAIFVPGCRPPMYYWTEGIPILKCRYIHGWEGRRRMSVRARMHVKSNAPRMNHASVLAARQWKCVKVALALTRRRGSTFVSSDSHLCINIFASRAPC